MSPARLAHGCSWGALVLTPCFLALPLAFLPLLLPHLLAFLLLLLPDLLALQALLSLLPALLLRSPRILLPLLLLGSLISLRWVRSTIHAPSSHWLVLHVRAVVVPSEGPVQPFSHRSGGPP